MIMKPPLPPSGGLQPATPPRPGWTEIKTVMTRLLQHHLAAYWAVFALHSQIASADQQRVFHPTPNGARKVPVHVPIPAKTNPFSNLTPPICDLPLPCFPSPCPWADQAKDDLETPSW